MVNATSFGDLAGPLRLQAGGTLNPRRHLYVERPEDRILFKLLSEQEYVNVLTSRQMGKSSLMVRTAQALSESGVRCAIVDLAAELGTPATSSMYFHDLLTKIARDLQIENKLPAWWRHNASHVPNKLFIDFFRDLVAPQIDVPIVCFLDEIDSTIKFPWADDLFVALRGMHNERPLNPAFERVSFCLLGVATPDELIKDTRTTPYNIGTMIELSDFDLERDNLSHLAQAVHEDDALGHLVVKRIMDWTDGHPYLTMRLCTELMRRDVSSLDEIDALVEKFLANLQSSYVDAHFRQIVRFIETRITDQADVLDLYRRILGGAREHDGSTRVHGELKLSGLVKRDRHGDLRVRNATYAHLFNFNWLADVRALRQLDTSRRTLQAREFLASRGVVIGQNRIGSNVIKFPRNAGQNVWNEVIEELKYISYIKRIDVSYTGIKEVTRLQDIDKSNLQSIKAAHSKIVGLGDIVGLDDLRELDLAYTEHLNTLDGLERLDRLQFLDLTETRNSDFSFLRKLDQLEEIILRGTNVTDCEIVSEITSLRRVSLAFTPILEIAPLACLEALVELELFGTSVVNVDAVSGLTKLRRLDLFGTRVAELAPLAELGELQWLDLAHTEVVDVAPLASLINLRKLDLSGTMVKRESVGELRRQLEKRGNRSILIVGP
jgi:AAA-like domain